jgi:hypothetical protein
MDLIYIILIKFYLIMELTLIKMEYNLLFLFIEIEVFL